MVIAMTDESTGQDETKEIAMSSPTVTTAEIFNRVALHLLTQREQCKEGSMCRYRGPNGTKCAVGCLITDEHYVGGLEGEAYTYGPRDNSVRQAVRNSLGRELTDEENHMLLELQHLHDDDDAWRSEFIGTTLLQRWISGITQLAEKYGVILSDEVVELMNKG